jgi:hypothetical protein
MMVIIILVVLTFIFGFALGNRNPRTGFGRLALLSCGPSQLLLAYALLMLFAFGERSVASFNIVQGIEWALSFGSVCVAGVLGVATGQYSRRGQGDR